MCKLLAIVDIENEDLAIEFSEASIKPMISRDNDGLGLVMMGDQGLGVERWLKPDEFPETGEVPEGLNKFKSLISVGYNTAGTISQKSIYALGVHSRMATSPKCLENVHPFVREGLALIHNGIISNHSKFQKEVSSCDSEALLSLYIDKNVKDNLGNVQQLCDEAIGSYAFMVFNPKEKSLTVVKDDKASLYLAHVPTVGIVFCTTEEIIKASCGKLKIKQPEIFTFPSLTAMRWIKGAAEIETFELSTPLIVHRSKCLHGTWADIHCKDCFDLDWSEKDTPRYLGGR